jgi:hypothetical protein
MSGRTESWMLDKSPRGRPSIVITGEPPTDLTQIVRETSCDDVTVNYARGFRGRDLAFLIGAPIRSLQVLTRTVSDVDSIYTLSGTLESLDVTLAERATIDLDRLQLLSDLSCDWSLVAESLAFSSRPRLRDLYVYAYGCETLEPLVGCQELASLHLKNCPRLRTLVGLPAQPVLQGFHLVLARRLEDVSALSHCAHLVDLYLEACKGVNRLDFVSPLGDLEYLTLAELGALQSLDPIQMLGELKSVALWGSWIVSKDLNPLLELPLLEELRMGESEGYSPTVAEVKRLKSIKF